MVATGGDKAANELLFQNRVAVHGLLF